MRAFAAGIARDPQLYFLTAIESASIDAAVGAFADALAVAEHPKTRTGVAVFVKDQKRAEAERVVQQYYSRIKVDERVSRADKIAAGVRPLNRDRVRAKCPRTQPSLSLRWTVGGQHELMYRNVDLLFGEGQARPAAAVGIQLAVALADRPVQDPAVARVQRTYTRGPIRIDYAHADGGKIATYFARWTSRSGDVGPWSGGVSQRVAA